MAVSLHTVLKVASFLKYGAQPVSFSVTYITDIAVYAKVQC